MGVAKKKLTRQAEEKISELIKIHYTPSKESEPGFILHIIKFWDHTSVDSQIEVYFYNNEKDKKSMVCFQWDIKTQTLYIGTDMITREPLEFYTFNYNEDKKLIKKIIKIFKSKISWYFPNDEENYI